MTMLALFLIPCKSVIYRCIRYNLKNMMMSFILYYKIFVLPLSACVIGHHGLRMLYLHYIMRLLDHGVMLSICNSHKYSINSFNALGLYTVVCVPPLTHIGQGEVIHLNYDLLIKVHCTFNKHFVCVM
jgi:hypothetical protein